MHSIATFFFVKATLCGLRLQLNAPTAAGRCPIPRGVTTPTAGGTATRAGLCGTDGGQHGSTPASCWPPSAECRGVARRDNVVMCICIS